MGLFDIFDSNPSEIRKGYNAGMTGLNKGYGDYTDILSKYYGGAKDELGGAYNDAFNFLRGARDDALSKYGEAKGYLNSALPTWQDLLDRANKGYSAYSDFSGANGAEGLQRGFENFQASPYYKMFTDLAQTGTEGINRYANAGRMLVSGNNLQDLSKYVGQLGAQEWGNYGANLAPYMGAANTAASGLSGLYSQLAGLGQSAGNMVYNSGGDLAKLLASKGIDISNLDTSLGGKLGDAALQKGVSEGELGSQYWADRRNADTSASGNLWSLLLGLGGLGSGIAGNYWKTHPTVGQ